MRDSDPLQLIDVNEVNNDDIKVNSLTNQPPARPLQQDWPAANLKVPYHACFQIFISPAGLQRSRLAAKKNPSAIKVKENAKTGREGLSFFKTEVP